jgi:hypothetical protein
MEIGISYAIVRGGRSLLGPFGGHATLGNDLVSAWPLSANGEDSHGANDLTNNNTVTFVAKGAGAPANMPANVANFVAASSQYFSRADDFSLATDFTLAYWMNFGGNPAGNPVFFSAYDTLPNDGQILFFYDSATTIYVRVGQGGNFQTASWAGNIDDDAWHLILFTFVGATGAGVLYVDDTQRGTLTATGRYAGPTPIEFGHGPGLNYYTGKLSSILAYSRVLTAGERTDLYNAGDGLFY